MAGSRARTGGWRRARGLLFAVAALVSIARTAHAEGGLVDTALERFERGEYEQVVSGLRDAVDAGGESIDRADRGLAFRLYGIACVVTGRRLAAESAFLRWLALEPRARLDATLVRPEVVAFFDDVRSRHRADILREVEKRRPRNPLLNFLSPAGQFQNGERGKFGVILGLELVTLGASLGTGVPLYTQRHADGTFDPSVHAEELRVANWISFGALAAVVAYSIVDGLVVYSRHKREYQLDEESLRAATGPRLRPTADGLAFAF